MHEWRENKKPKPKKCFLAQASCHLNQYNFGHNLCSTVMNTSESRLLTTISQQIPTKTVHFSTYLSWLPMIVLGMKWAIFWSLNVDVKLKIFTKSTPVKKVAECQTYLKQYCHKDRCEHSPEEHRQYRISPLHSYYFSAGSWNQWT